MDTSASLLDSLQASPDGEAWGQLVDIYTPMIRSWLQRHGVPRPDADDVTQEVFTVVVRRFPEFRREPRAGAFRRWLRNITVNCLRDHWRRKKRHAPAVGGTDFVEVINQLADSASGISKQWDQEHDAYLTQFLLKKIRHFSPKPTGFGEKRTADDIRS